jgi:hypothetical protein
MAHGGRREGAGRPSATEAEARAKADAEAIANAPRVSPVDYLAGILASSGSTKSQKMRACELLLRRAATADALPVSAPDIPINIYSVPRGTQIKDGKIVWPSGVTSDPEPLAPYPPTPMLEPLHEERAEPEPLPFAVEELEPPPNVTRLDSFVRRREDDSEPGPGAA